MRRTKPRLDLPLSCSALPLGTGMCVDKRFLTVVVLVACLSLVKGKDVSNGTQVEWYRTTQSTKDRLSKQPQIQFGGDFPSDTVMKINRSVTYQIILGFGGAFTDAASYVFSKLNPTLQSQVLDMYFSEDGLRYNMARLPMGSCDFSLENYNYANTSGDVNLDNFSIDHDKDRIIPFIKRAMSTIAKWKGDSLQIVASPWSPPKWMKKNNSPYCPLDCLGCTVKDEYQETWALYFSKFISAYSQEGIPIWGVTVQNEPEACPLVYEGLHFNPETERDFIKQHLGPKLRKDHPDLKILIYDHNKDHVVKWAQTIYSDSEASQYVWGTAIHWYTGDQFENVNTTHNLFPDIPILATEATEVREKDPTNPVWGKGEHYAHDIMGDINNWVVGFIDWNLILDMLGGPDHAGPDRCEGIIKCGSDGMLLADTAKQIVYPQVFYYYVGHISKFVPRGSVRIFNQVVQSSLECVAFVTPVQDVVVVVMNRGDDPVTFKLLDDNGGKMQALNFTALPHSIQTFMYH